MERSVDVKALKAKFHSKTESFDSSRESSSPISPLTGFGRGGLLAEASVSSNRIKKLPVVTSPIPGLDSSPDLPRFPRPVRVNAGGGPNPRPQLPQGVFPRPPPSHRQYTKTPPPPVLPSKESGTPSNVKVAGEMLQNMMLKHQAMSPAKPGPSTHPPPAKPVPSAISSSAKPGPSAHLPPAKPGPSGPPLLPSQKTRAEVTPLRKPLPPEGPRPLKPKRPLHVNLEQFQKKARAPPTPRRSGLRKIDGSSSSGSSSLSQPGLVSPTGPPRPRNKPSSLPRLQPPGYVGDTQDETYDDIDHLPPPPPPPNHPGSFDTSDSWTDNGSSQFDGGSDESEVYDTIDEEPAAKSSSSNKMTEREMKRQKEQELKELEKRQKREKEYKKKFKLSDEVEVIHTATVRCNWQGGKHDLSVQQGEIVEIIRVNNNPGGKWLARTMSGIYGYISNTCVDVDYESMKRKHSKAGIINPLLLPPPPPDPVQDNDIYYDVDSSDHYNSSAHHEDDSDGYDDVQEMLNEFPPPPLEISLDSKLEKELRTKFKFNGPVTVLHTMMIDPNANIKKAGGKDLSVVRGEILDVIQITNYKKALCRNSRGKYGYVPRSHLLPMEGDIYDDVDHNNDVYDNDTVQ